MQLYKSLQWRTGSRGGITRKLKLIVCRWKSRFFLLYCSVLDNQTGGDWYRLKYTMSHYQIRLKIVGIQSGMLLTVKCAWERERERKTNIKTDCLKTNRAEIRHSGNNSQRIRLDGRPIRLPWTPLDPVPNDTVRSACSDNDHWQAKARLSGQGEVQWFRETMKVTKGEEEKQTEKLGSWTIFPKDS